MCDCSGGIHWLCPTDTALFLTIGTNPFIILPLLNQFYDRISTGTSI
jgi:hypothetical protein